jgi:O-antigen/teichoic acid export membrane protein
LAAIPVSIAIAVLKYRLYDLDRIVSRTVTYALVAALLVAAYGLIVLGLGSFLGRDNPLAIAAATLAAAALFNPLRTRIRGWVDRRFNRSRYDAERVIEGFVSSMRDRVDPDGLVEGWIGVATETMQPTAVGAWVRS